MPGSAVLTIAGGFLFGIAFGTVWVVIAATAGATALFLMARTVLGDGLRKRAGTALRKMEAGFSENAFSYLLSLRLIPVFLFFLINIVPAFLGVSLRTYVVATLIGIIPGAFVFASIGAGLGSIFDMMSDFTLAGALTPQVIVALASLSVLSLVPPLYKKLKARRRQPERSPLPAFNHDAWQAGRAMPRSNESGRCSGSCGQRARHRRGR